MIAPSELSTAELKAELGAHGIDFAGCVEKCELVALVEKTARRAGAAVSAPIAKRARTDASATGREAAMIDRLIAALPAEERRDIEPEPSHLFAPHTVPTAAATHLRICTFNLLNDSLPWTGLHAVWGTRRVNALRCLLAIDADAYLLQELNGKSVDFLRAMLGDEYELSDVRGGVAVMYRTAPREGRSIHFAPAGKAFRRKLEAPSFEPGKTQFIGAALNVPLDVYGCPGLRRLVLTTVHLITEDGHGQMISTNTRAPAYAALLGRDLLRLPARFGAPMVLGGDFNPGTSGKRASTAHGPSLHAELTTARCREPDSEDAWSEDDEVLDSGLAWPPPRTAPLARDLWRETPSDAREYGGLQSGSTCMPIGQKRLQQGVDERAAARGWEDGGACTDEGHIDWLLASEAGAPRLRATRAVVGTERLCPPLPPRNPAGRVPAGGAIFPSDHYPVFVDLEVGPLLEHDGSADAV